MQTATAKFITEDKETADCWIEERKEFYPNSKYMVIKLHHYFDCRGIYCSGGYAVATKKAIDYIAKYEKGTRYHSTKIEDFER